MLVCVLTSGIGNAWAQSNLLESQPFDRIEMNDEDGTVLEVLPLDFPNRRIPTNPRSTDTIRLRRLDDPTAEYEMYWRDVAYIELYEQMLLDEAMRLAEAGDYDAAYPYFALLEKNYSEWPGLAESTEYYLFENATALAGDEQWETALAVLLELHERNPEYEGLDAALAGTIERLARSALENESFDVARRFLDTLMDRLGDNTAAESIRGALLDRVTRTIESAESDRAAGRWFAAAAAARRGVRVWPEHENARRLLSDLVTNQPTVVVGVTELADDHGISDASGWAVRRVNRLTDRTLFELVDFGDEGGTYASPFGSNELVDLGRAMAMRTRPGTYWNGSDEPITAFDVSRTVFDLASPDPSRGSAATAIARQWTDVFASVDVPDPTTVEIQLRRFHVRPEALLQVSLQPWSSAASSAATCGPYVRSETTETYHRFTAGEGYFATGDRQPVQLEEVRVATTHDGVTALVRGEIAMLDRVNPWDHAVVRQHPRLVLVRYGAPTVHCLLPNLSRRLPANRTLRRALLYGIDRAQILNRRLLRGAEINGCEVANGPFPTGYARDSQVEPRPYAPRLAMALGRVVSAELAAREASEAEPRGVTEANDAEASAEGDDPPAPVPLELRIAHPPTELARVACGEIEAQLEVLGFQIELVESPTATVAQDIDFYYVELTMLEPVVDVHSLLGKHGLLRDGSAYLDLALRRLSEASDWPTARNRLFEIHRIVHDDAAVLPLWQLAEYLVHDVSIRGIGETPVSLYQHVENWSVEPWQPQLAGVGDE